MKRPLHHNTRREVLGLGIPFLAGAALPQTGSCAAQAGEGAEAAADRSEPWPARRARMERAWLDLLGEFPREILPLKVAMKEVARDGEITRYHVSFQSEPDDRVTAWLLVPDAARRRPVPAIVCVHSTTWGSGKDSTIGLSGRRPIDPPRDPQVGAAYGRDLARHGFVTLSIDLLTDGERIEPGRRIMDTRVFYARHPDWSIVGKNIWDVMRSVDFLQTLDTVTADQIGAIGWSLGGHSALFAAAFEPRITAVVSNGGVLDWHRHVDAWSRLPDSWTPWQEGDPPTNNPTLERRFGFKTNSGPYIYIKRFRPYIDDPTLPIPVGFAELMMMVAPRPQLILSTEQEFYRHKVFPKCLEAFRVYLNWRDTVGMPSVVRARQERIGYDQTLAYYEKEHGIAPERMPDMFHELGAADCFSWFSFPGGHGFPGVARRHAFAWFDRWLGRTLE
ncbi:MAG: dienelactone hydrolase family protein [Pirellulaceae bacterium]